MAEFSSENGMQREQMERKNTSNNSEAVVQQQLDAYNARDIEALMACYADDARQFEHPAKLLASGSAEIRARFIARFAEPNLHAQLLQRVVSGNFVIDHERVTCTFPEGMGTQELIAIYELRQDRIANAWFIPSVKTVCPEQP